ncbi:MAG: hypothetical protein ACFFGZ_10585 [Candidatus Thorarchaeota archaeon]
MEFLDERSRRIILSLTGSIFFFYSCVILPLFRILPYGTLEKTAQLERTPLGSIEGSVESKFYYDAVELQYWLSGFLDFHGQFELSYSGIGKNSDYWFLWHATEIWGPIAILLGIAAAIILFTDNLSILVQEKPALPFGWKIAVVIGITAVSIEWFLFLLLWLSGEAEAGTAVGTIGLKPVPGWPLLFLNLLGVLGLLWAAFQAAKAANF